MPVGRRSGAGNSSSVSAATATSSPGHLPTTSASRARSNGNGSEPRRFEDFVGGSGGGGGGGGSSSTFMSDADDTFSAAIKGKKRGSEEMAARSADAKLTRGPRKTYNEVADDSGFVFTMESKRPAAPAPTEAAASSSLSSSSSATAAAAAAPSAMGPPAVPQAKTKSGASAGRKSKVIREPLPSDQMGETPINRRNQLFRGGPAYPSTPGVPRRTGSGSSRRSSLNFKTSRRSSSLRDGTTAYPHPSVPDKELYRHCADNIPPVARMKHLAGWTLERARGEVLSAGSSSAKAAPAGPKGKRAKVEDQQSSGADAWGPHEKKMLDRCQSSLGRVMIDALRDLGDQKIPISWLGKASSTSAGAPEPRPNPLNASNKALADQMGSLVAALRSENARWEKERKEIEAYEAETAALVGVASSSSSVDKSSANPSLSTTDITLPPKLVSSAETQADDLAWDSWDLGSQMDQMMQDARRALAMEEGWLPDVASSPTVESEALEKAIRAAAATRRSALQNTLSKKGKRGSEAAAMADEDDSKASAGTEQDPRWKDFEFQSDLLHSRTHIMDRLSLLSSSYTSSISSRAAQALRQLAFAPADAGAGQGTSSAASGTSSVAAGEGSESRQNNRERRERILRGIRESIGPLRRQEMEDEEAEVKREEAEAAQKQSAHHDDSGIQLADQSAVDLFRAFASTKTSGSGEGGSGEARRGKAKAARTSRR